MYIDYNMTTYEQPVCEFIYKVSSLENAYAVPYVGQNKADVESLHMVNRNIINERGEL